MLLIFLYYQHAFPQPRLSRKPRQQATFTPHPAKGTPECTEVSKWRMKGYLWVETYRLEARGANFLLL